MNVLKPLKKKLSSHTQAARFNNARRLLTMEGETPAQRKGFGSFHSDDIEDLIRATVSHFQVPQINEEFNLTFSESLNTFENAASPNIRQLLYGFDPKWNFINHGAFGATVRPLTEEAERWRRLCESQPLRFFDRLLLPSLAYSIRMMSKFIDCPRTELMPLSNVTSGLNALINSIPLQPDDEVICFSLTYGSTKKMLRDACTRTGARLIIIQISLPVKSLEDFELSFVKFLSRKAKLIILDQITSNTAMCIPVVRLASICKEHTDAVVVVDAAHSLFSQDVSLYGKPQPSAKGLSPDSTKPVEMASIGQSVVGFLGRKDCELGNPDDVAEVSLAEVVDAWISNGHKWLCAPKGCAFMWVSPRLCGKVRPAIISHGFTPQQLPPYGEDSMYPATGRLLSAFSWDGCRDYAAMLSIPSALLVWTAIAPLISIAGDAESGPGKTSKPSVATSSSSRHPSSSTSSSSPNSISTEATEDSFFPESVHSSIGACRRHNRRLLREATELISHEWRVGADDFAAPRAWRENSPMSLIPLPERVRGVVTTSGTTDKEAFQLQELLHHEHRIEVPIKCLEGRLYARVSAHVYNKPEDYAQFAAVVKALAKQRS